MQKFDESILKEIIDILTEMTNKSYLVQVDRDKQKKSDRGWIFLAMGLVLAVSLYMQHDFLATLIGEEYFRWVLMGLGIVAWALTVLFFVSFKKYNKPIYSNLLEIHSKSTVQDTVYINKLIKFPTAYLKFSLVQYESNVLVLENRVQTFSGAIQSRGVLPALLGVAVTLVGIAEPKALILLIAASILVAGFYIFRVYATLTAERPKQVAQLLQLVIDLGDEDTNKESILQSSVESRYPKE
ncbi:hypothetical protein EV681_4490 [Advenella incenata]|uniref:Uncharacterized protein n=1 Tax=Advenella incenata TaxID=267800 RepID=A0A4Q7V8B5_9BURK|nr:hypothetical protein [Advenella incenata]RZT91730.1 hypothetical protein EV681_4490 [Advenella incenata]